MFYAKNQKTGKIIANSYNEIVCIDEAVKIVKDGFKWINWVVVQTLNFDKFTKEDKLDFLDRFGVMIYETDLSTELPETLQKPENS